MKELILSKLKLLEAEHNVRVLYACESGSRAWGFASEDSDYDVRFVYVHESDWYLSVRDRNDSMDFALDENELDLSGWDFRKALGLFAKSNGALLEWLHSPVVYFEDESVVPRWRELVSSVMVPKALAGHYLGLCKNVWHRSLQAEEVSAKKYLYALRALFSAQWVMEKGTPAPVAFEALRAGLSFDSAVENRVAELVALKQAGEEFSQMPRDVLLHELLESQMDVLSKANAELPSRVPDLNAVDVFFRSVVRA